MTVQATKQFYPSQSPSYSADPVKSQCKTSERSEILYLSPVRSVEFRKWFAPVFSRWLRDEFHSPEQVAMAFSVRSSTAWTWWNGENRASGDAVARLFMAFPNAAIWFREQWEAQK